MITSIFDMVFLVFSFEPVLVCCGMVLVVSLFGLIRRFLTGNFSFKE